MFCKACNHKCVLWLLARNLGSSNIKSQGFEVSLFRIKEQPTFNNHSTRNLSQKINIFYTLGGKPAILRLFEWCTSFWEMYKVTNTSSIKHDAALSCYRQHAVQRFTTPQKIIMDHYLNRCQWVLSGIREALSSCGGDVVLGHWMLLTCIWSIIKRTPLPHFAVSTTPCWKSTSVRLITTSPAKLTLQIITDKDNWTIKCP